MKVPASIRTAHAEQAGRAGRLKLRVDSLLASKKHPRWHYESRIKGIESFALKVESGRVQKPAELEDFFACTLVVRNLQEVDTATKIIGENFSARSCRPPSATMTKKRPECFPFDDLRLYVRWQDDSATPPSGLTDVTFEIQIKTFLQHAWAIATHDLIYKAAEVHWGKQRIAFQVKAMLEHAELSIQEASKLASNVPKKSDVTEQLSKTIKFLAMHWCNDELPRDQRRLADNVNRLCVALRLDLAALGVVLGEETAGGLGTRTLNLSPFGVIVQSLANRRWADLERCLTARGSRVRVLVPAEIELPDGVDRRRLVNAIFM